MFIMQLHTNNKEGMCNEKKNHIIYPYFKYFNKRLFLRNNNNLQKNTVGIKIYFM